MHDSAAAAAPALDRLMMATPMLMSYPVLDRLADGHRSRRQAGLGDRRAQSGARAGGLGASRHVRGRTGHNYLQPLQAMIGKGPPE